MIAELDLKNLQESKVFTGYLNKYDKFQDKLSGAASSMADFAPNGDIIGADQQSKLDSAMSNADGVMNRGLDKFDSQMSKVQNVSYSTDVDKIAGKGPTGGLIKQLIGLILGIIKLPVRLARIAEGLTTGTMALGMSVEGLGLSVGLAAEDLWLLIVTIASLIVKYFLCILSFTITTIAGCILVHAITFTLSVMFLIFPLSAYVIEMLIGYDMTPEIDLMFERMHEIDDLQATYTKVNLLRWPYPIELFCYTCFGKPVKLKDVLVDVWAIKSVGDIISYDFSVRMPGYMKVATPMAKASGRAFDKAMN